MLRATSLTAQKHDNVWMQGNYNNFYIDFKDLRPDIYTVNSEYNFRTMSFLSDANGNPAFYSNGCSVRNANHEWMENGEDLLLNDYDCIEYGYKRMSHGAGVTLPGFDEHQFVMINLSVDLPYPAQPCEVNRLVVHYIDVAAQQGKGEVTIKGQVILTGCFQEPSATKHANGRDWWIVLPDNQVGRFYRWLLTPNGLEGPWEQSVDNPTIDGLTYRGWSEFSRDGQRYMIKGARKGVAVYDFDRCTGLLSQPFFLAQTGVWNFSASFSNSGDLLYTVSDNTFKLWQYDLTSSDIDASKVLLGEWDGTVDSFNIPAVFGFMQHGPDGRMYIWGGGSALMHLIEFPDRMGSGCNLRQYALHLPGSCASASLYYPNYRLGPLDGSACDTIGIDNLPVALFRYDMEDTLSPLQQTFTDLSYYEPDTWFWDFGDGTQSQEKDPVHSFPSPGTYTVCLTASNANASDTYCRQVTVGTVGIEALPALPHVEVSPNPFSGELRVQLPALVGVSPRFVLYDLYGREVHTAWLRDFDTYISLSQLPVGMYVWQLRWNGVATQSGRVVKQ